MTVELFYAALEFSILFVSNLKPFRVFSTHVGYLTSCLNLVTFCRNTCSYHKMAFTNVLLTTATTMKATATTTITTTKVLATTMSASNDNAYRVAFKRAWPAIRAP